MQDIGRKLLLSVGADEATITDEQIEQAIAANDALIVQLEAIRDAAGYSTEELN